jgi:hypothetical protein
MATTTATITIASSDIADNSFSVSNTSTIYTAGTDTGITETTGLGRKTFATGVNTILLDAGLSGGIAQDVTVNKAAKVYIKNINDRGDGTKFVNILLATTEIGRLYGNDWMFIPWCAADTKDIEFTASDNTPTTLEYIVFYE